MTRLLLICLLGLTVACGPNAKMRTVSTTLAAVNTARAGFATYDASKEQQIIVNAKTREWGETMLAEWRLKSDRVIRSLLSMYAAISLAATDLSDQNIAAMLRALAAFEATYRDVVGKDPR